MNILQKMNDAVEYIENSICGEIDYKKAAQIACCSKDQFGRLFSYYSGITLTEYIRQRALTLCAFELQQNDIKIIDLAVKYGYDSHASFTRAFREYHGVTPGEARNKNTVLNVCPKIEFKNADFQTKRRKNIELKTIGSITSDNGVNFFHCFASLVMYIGKKFPERYASAAYTDGSLRMGKCVSGDTNAIYEKTKSLYGLVSGHTAMLFDMTDKFLCTRTYTEICDTVLREFDDYVKYSMDYAGYEYTSFNNKVSKNELFAHIKNSIDKDMPVLMQFKKNKSWAVITGYNEELQIICNCNRNHSYFRSHADDLSKDESDTHFLISDWYSELDLLYIVRDLPQKSELTIKNAYDRFNELLEFILDKGWYDKAKDFINDDNNFKDKSPNELKTICADIDKFIAFPIYYRSMASWCSDTLVDNDNSVLSMRPYWSFISRFCTNTFQVCVNLRRLVGNKSTKPTDGYEMRLKDKTIRKVIAESIDIIMSNDRMITWTIGDYNDYINNRR